MPVTHWTERILLLLRQERAPQAEQELRQMLHDDPTDALAHGWLGMALLEQNKLEEGQQEAELAIHLAPEYDFAYYLLSLAHLRQHRPQEAQQAIEQALALDPADPNYHHTLGIIRFRRGQWEAALRAAETGLRYDPAHIDCLGLRGRALARLGRRADAADTLQEALRHDPDAAGTHADAGWVALEAGRPKQALGFFREALRLHPTSDYAREGLVEALKARYWLYRGFLKFAYWSTTLSDGTRRALFIGLWVLARFVPLLLPLYLLLVFMSWFADPLFNSLLRLNSHGRHALSPDQVRQSNQFLVLLLGGTVAVAGGLLGQLPAVELLGYATLGLLFPVVGTWRLLAPKRQRQSMWFAGGLAVVGLIAVGLVALGLPQTYVTPALALYFGGLVVYVWTYALR
ncbi:tetratricopeptide repeat protein [Hymenobacter sp. NBH84]|uniref:Tetratricopeptide repeat protein n=1 Tax=Hymenobacter defluvii TaxID=2054411 RepID=A0ABS3TD41_9BACT|nr:MULTISPECIES: tetratricopeptide repeat protein [Hymenobacter]MBO3271580.1 tetratricopeptide repeat protein [Hymenobacter defluvii]QNE38327.1 tetratricopeptide repeat protein [Hymenobacter sp. NBH84]